MNNEIRQGQAWTEEAISDVFVGVEFEGWYEEKKGTYILRGTFGKEKNLEFIVSSVFLGDIPNSPDSQKKTPSLIQKYFETWKSNPHQKHKFEIFEKLLK